VPQAEIAARIQGFVEGFGGRLAGNIVEIDEKISAKNYVEVAVGESIGGSARLTRVNSTACRNSSQS